MTEEQLKRAAVLDREIQVITESLPRLDGINKRRAVELFYRGLEGCEPESSIQTMPPAQRLIDFACLAMKVAFSLELARLKEEAAKL